MQFALLLAILLAVPAFGQNQPDFSRPVPISMNRVEVSNATPQPGIPMSMRGYVHVVTNFVPVNVTNEVWVEDPDSVIPPDGIVSILQLLPESWRPNVVRLMLWMAAARIALMFWAHRIQGFTTEILTKVAKSSSTADDEFWLGVLRSQPYRIAHSCSCSRSGFPPRKASGR
jgi:hypothetical protein